MTAAWATARERGSAGLLRLGAGLALRLGWPVGRALLPPITGWFLATSAGARAASREYLERALGRPARPVDVARHFHAFAAATLDRLFLLAGHAARFRVETEGLEVLHAAVAEGRGCVLLGAHHGSFEVLRVAGQGRAPVPVRAVMYRRNAGALSALLDRLNPTMRDAVIEIGEPASMLRVHEAVRRGEIVCLLADRSPGGPAPGPREARRTVRVPFLGHAAAFPAGPFLLAAATGAPVFLVHAARTGPRRYAVRFTPFADRLALRRARRAEDLADWVGRYAAALDTACRAHPYEWFNFFPFWDDPPHANPSSPAAAGASPALPARSGPDAGHPA